MINRLMTTEIRKRQKLRNNEYYDTQEMFDDLYNKSKNKDNYRFYKLMDLITDERNIELAYRNIKRNKGSATQGVNGHTITDVEIATNGNVVDYVRNRLQNYQPHEVRRVYIPKENGKTRPLGIPTMEDRIIQQCIKQVLEPICEGKFYNHSYGFRPNRSAHHAVARCKTLMNKSKLQYVVDIDIKGFFDNVNHGKLLKQMWSMGIQDKQLLCIISKMLKAPIENEGVPTKGTPQGGILSPLLSNIVLNELDWWVANQWEHFETEHNYLKDRGTYIDHSHKYRAMRNTDLKEMWIVRYADDFKIFTKDYKTAKKIFNAVKMWLKERLHLDISEEKSKIVNLNTNYSEYLGFKMKLHNKSGKKVAKSHMSNKAKNKAKRLLKGKIKEILKDVSIKNIYTYNAMVLGMQNYYKIATNVNVDFAEINYKVSKIFNTGRFKQVSSNKGIISESYKKFYSGYNGKTYFIKSKALYPIYGVTNKPPMNFSQDICNYTKAGREYIHKKQQSVSTRIMNYIMENPVENESIEYNDNRISLYVAQKGVCPISRRFLTIGDMECHHKVPKSKNGTDEYKNLIFLTTDVHKLVHATEEEIIKKYKNLLNLDDTALKKLNKLRTLVGNVII